MGNVKPALKKLHIPGRDGKPMTLCQFPEAVGSRSRKVPQTLLAHLAFVITSRRIPVIISTSQKSSTVIHRMT